MKSQDIAVLYVDDELLAVLKPANLLSVPGRGEAKQDCMAARVQAAWPDALVVHRLDMATSGLMLMARSLAVQRQLGRAFAQREVDKRYEAIVDGVMPADSGTIELSISADWPRRPLQRIDPLAGKPALTHWRVLQRGALAECTRVELQPVTGRTHQLRLHLQAVGHPIWGDALYAGTAPAARSPRLLLHARTLRLRHPGDGRPLALHCAVPF